MTLQELQANASLNTRKIKAFGGEVTIRDLSIKEMQNITSLKDENDMLATIVSISMVDPKITVEELNNLGVSALPHLTAIVNAVNGTK